MLNSVGLSIPNDDLRPAFQDGSAELRDVEAGILIVAVGIDDDIGAKPQARVDTGSEGNCKAFVALVVDNIISTALVRYLDRSVGAAVIYDKDLDAVDPLYIPGYVGEGCRQSGFLVKAGNLNN